MTAQVPLPASGPAAEPTPGVEERRLRRHLGLGSLTATGFSNIVGSGWLFAAMNAPRRPARPRC
ncbi:MAG TPA: hypothetical protein VGH99_08355 [Pseudonocardia sp.]|jgi:hypothetical protein